MQNFKCELLHTKFCRFILGVHKKSTNFGVLSELGRFPIYYDIFQSMLSIITLSAQVNMAFIFDININLNENHKEMS
jgi:hypothetical protein